EESVASASSAGEVGDAHREGRPRRSSLRAHLGFELPPAEPREAAAEEAGGAEEGAPERHGGGSGPSKWRANALDVGDKLACSSAARSGGASVDSIVDLVEAERELWAEERLALEARLEELREQQKLRLAQEGGGAGADPEKESLRKRVQELRGAIKEGPAAASAPGSARGTCRRATMRTTTVGRCGTRTRTPCASS
ncbi:unnamed protein product, partial [Prorocentrum cordatum]